MQREPLFTLHSRIETDIGVHALPFTKLKIFSLVLVNFLEEYKFSSLREQHGLLAYF